jgi:hypothetical protein
MAKKRGLSMKINKTMFIITTSLALWIIASAGHADGSLNTQIRYGNSHTVTPYYHYQNPVIYPKQHYYPQGTTVIIVQPQSGHSGHDVYQRNLKRNRIGNGGRNSSHYRQNQCLGSHCGE